MGFILSKYTDNEAGLTVSFSGETNSDTYFSGNNIQDAMDYFNLYLENGRIFITTDEELAIEELGLANTAEATQFREELNEIIADYDDEQALDHAILYANWLANKSYAINCFKRTHLNPLGHQM